MKKYMALLCLVSSNVVAEGAIETVSIYCGDTTRIFKELSSKYKESPSWLGKDESANAITTLWLSKTEETYTITMTRDNKTCVLTTGSFKET